MKRKITGIILCIAMIFTLCCCDKESSTEATEQTETDSILAGMIEVEYTDNDKDASYKSGTKIVLDGESAKISGKGASEDSGVIEITSEGTYILSGEYKGQIVVDTEDKVKLVLNGVSIESENSACIYVKNADKVFLTLAEESENTLSDSESYELEDGEDEPNACIFSKDDLTINGAGSLTVNGNYNNGITCKDDLTITGGNISIEAANHGIKGKDSVQICDGSIEIKAGSDGIKSTNTEDEGKGYVSIDGGTLNIDAGNDGIQAETVLQVTDGNVTIETAGGSGTASTDAGYGDSWGPAANGQPVPPGSTTEEQTADDESAKGLKAGKGLYVTGGEIELDTSDDAMHSNDLAVMYEGSIKIESGDDGLHADNEAYVAGGSIKIEKSYEGIEAANIYVSDGDVYIEASDDGFNAAGGNDGSGEGQYEDGGDYVLDISGGNIEVIASGDGLDSNKDIKVSGGKVYVSGPENDGNGSIDYGTENNGECTISGGTVIAAGSSGMAETFGSSSKQCSFIAQAQGQSGDTITLKDSDGNEICSYETKASYSCIVISADELSDGSTYTLEYGSSSMEIELDGVSTQIGSVGTGGGGMGMGSPQNGPGM